MRVKGKFYNPRLECDITTAQLIARGAFDRDGQIESLEAQIEHLTEVLAAVIDRMGLSNEDILKITGCEWRYELVKVRDL